MISSKTSHYDVEHLGRIFPWIEGMSALCAGCGHSGSLLCYAHFQPYVSGDHKQTLSIGCHCGIALRKYCPL